MGELTTFILERDGGKMEVSSLLLDFCLCIKLRLELMLDSKGLFSFLLVDTAFFFVKHLADILWALSIRPIEVLFGS